VKNSLDVGGQAVIEGVMMRGPRSMVIAVRRPDSSIIVKDGQWVPLFERMPWLKLPFIRGAVVMVEALINGMQALSFSAEVSMDDEKKAAEAAEAAEAEEAGVDAPVNLHAKATEDDADFIAPDPMTKGAIALSLIFSLGLGVGLFIYLPHAGAAVIFNLVEGLPLSSEAPVEAPLFHLVVGIIKMTIFVCYVLAIRQMNDIYRVFQYHGAEHKSIHAYEAGEELTVENARKWPTYHPRCGTSFLVFVILISIGFFAAVFPLLQAYLLPSNLSGALLNLVQASVKIPLMIPIAGLSYEFIKWAGRQKENRVLCWLGIPGRMVQKITTVEPDDDQLEVALVSLKRALEHEGALDAPDYRNCTFVPAA